MINKNLYLGLLMGIVATGCSEKEHEDGTRNEVLSPCNIVLGNMEFTQSKNGAENRVTVFGDTLKFIAGAQTDYFRSPNGSVIDTSPVIFTEVDNTKPFTFTAKVEPEFTKNGTYSAGVLYAYANKEHCQKLCFEQDEYGIHRIVTVRTIGTSDDNNHQSIEGPSVYMRISSDGKQIGNYFSEDGKTWHMARLYGNDFRKKLFLGLSSQSPKDNEHTCRFSEVSITETAVSDFRNGKLKNE
ncbi:DUF1349 domain-containing protein [Akkermansia muciniphila]|uniref:DUF1349 domain-containing protein n=1 Tax=Akkermansia muciniphila TaxID=239935 RepID=UPI000B8E5E9C|nr:DUF1349 domain-containing protein [Akkermansia muciniphila]